MCQPLYNSNVINTIILVLSLLIKVDIFVLMPALILSSQIPKIITIWTTFTSDTKYYQCIIARNRRQMSSIIFYCIFVLAWPLLQLDAKFSSMRCSIKSIPYIVMIMNSSSTTLLSKLIMIKPNIHSKTNVFCLIWNCKSLKRNVNTWFNPNEIIWDCIHCHWNVSQSTKSRRHHIIVHNTPRWLQLLFK